MACSFLKNNGICYSQFIVSKGFCQTIFFIFVYENGKM